MISPILAKLISYIIKRWDEKCEIPGLIPTSVVSLILFFSWLAHAVGAPELLGGFAAGFALLRHFYFPLVLFLQETKKFSLRIEETMKPIVHLFTPIFFVSIGLSLNFTDVNWSSTFIWLLTGSLLHAAIVGKLFSSFFLKGESQLMIGTAMTPRGEFG